eukprot:824696-Amorphochlora_amoeboformis.AAC.1
MMKKTYPWPNVGPGCRKYRVMKYDISMYTFLIDSLSAELKILDQVPCERIKPLVTSVVHSPIA